MSKPDNNQGWRRLLRTNKSGEPLGCSTNAHLVLKHDPSWDGVLAYDQFAGDIVTRKKPPWGKMMPAEFKLGDWSDKDTWRAKIWLGSTHGFEPSLSETGGALHVLADETAFHPVVEWLKSLRHRPNSKTSIDTWLTDFCGVEDTPYVRAIGRNFLISAVARVFDPGCQLDDMPIFEGAQGVGKSTMLRILASDEWFMSTNLVIGSKDGYQQLRRKWIIEFGELEAMGRHEIAAVKQFTSQRVDRYRPSYGTRAIDFRRQCALVGTVNPEEGGYLKDQTGNRRFRPVYIPRMIDLPGLAKARDALWAEAVVRFKAGEQWYISDPELLREAAAIAEDRRQGDPREGAVAEWLAHRGPATRASGVTTHQLLTDCLGLELGKLTRTDEMFAAAAMGRAGWKSGGKERAFGSTAVRVYRPEGALKAIKGGKYIEKNLPRGGAGGYGRKPKTT